MPQKQNQCIENTNTKITENGIVDATFAGCEEISTDHRSAQNNEISQQCSNCDLDITSNCISLTCSTDKGGNNSAENDDGKNACHPFSKTVLQNHTKLFNECTTTPTPNCDSLETVDFTVVNPELHTGALSITNQHDSNLKIASQSSDELVKDSENLDSEGSKESSASSNSLLYPSNSELCSGSDDIDNNERFQESHAEDVDGTTQDEVDSNENQDHDLLPPTSVIMKQFPYGVEETNAISSPCLSESSDSEALSNSDLHVNSDDSTNLQLHNPKNSNSWTIALPEKTQKVNEDIMRRTSQKNDEFSIQRDKNERINTTNAMSHHLTTNSDDDIPLCGATADIYEVQMAALENTITQLQREVDMYREKLAERDEIAKNAYEKLKRDLSLKLEMLTRQLENSEKEKEAMVVKYAICEKTVLSLKKIQEELERKLREANREKDMVLGKIRILTNERARLSQAFDNKASEMNNLQRECERLKEEILSKDVKIKWAQNKLKTEADSHKDTLIKLEKTHQKLKETREEAEQVRRDCQEMIRTYQESEEIKSNSLDIRLKEKESELELERQQKSDKEEVYHIIRSELEALKKKHKLGIDENNALTMKLQSLERERLDYEQNLSKLKEQLNSGQQEIVDLQAKLAEMDNLTAQISREKEKVTLSHSEIERLRQTNADLQIDMEACRRKEGELLEFTERLTSKNVALQSENSCLEAKLQAQEREVLRLSKLHDEADLKISTLTTQLVEEQHLRKQDTQILARKLAEKTKMCDNLNLKLDEQVNDIKVLRRKNTSTIRELTKELQLLHRRLDLGESRTGSVDYQTLGSRTSSTGSLDTLSYVPNAINNTNENVARINGTNQDTKANISHDSPQEPTRQMLIERIVKLQKLHARKNEKIEFLEEHVNQMLNEIKKKTKLIQHFIMREEAGALAPISMDRHKLELSRKGGIMASLYTSHQADDGMTIELALEISRKLQAVLEDTLLKNITLKGNIKTLGEEIERLNREKRQLQN